MTKEFFRTILARKRGSVAVLLFCRFLRYATDPQHKGYAFLRYFSYFIYSGKAINVQIAP